MSITFSSIISTAQLVFQSKYSFYEHENLNAAHVPQELMAKYENSCSLHYMDIFSCCIPTLWESCIILQQVSKWRKKVTPLSCTSSLSSLIQSIGTSHSVSSTSPVLLLLLIHSSSLLFTTLSVSSPKSFSLLGRQVNLMVEWWLVGWTPTISHTHSMRLVDLWLIQFNDETHSITSLTCTHQTLSACLMPILC